MKANRKFLTGDEEAVSPVIAVILMVAITVVLAATVYVWVSGFSGGQGNSKTLSLTSNGAITSGSLKAYTVASATSGMKWQDLDFTLDGASLTLDGADCSPASGFYTVCAGGTPEADDRTVDAGDQIKFYVTSGQTLRVIDATANSVILTLTVG